MLSTFNRSGGVIIFMGGERGPGGDGGGPSDGLGGPGGGFLRSSSGLPLPPPWKPPPEPPTPPLGPLPHKNDDPPTSIEGFRV